MRFAILLVVAFFAAHPAQATPPQTIEVSETLLGINGTHLFVLRRIDDNLGYYIPVQTDVVLIARNRKTNTDDQVWPVMRMVEYGVEFPIDGPDDNVKVLPLPDRVNPFDILLWRKARPLLSPDQLQYFSPFRATDNLTTSFAQEALTIVDPTPSSEATFQIKDTVVTGLIRRSLNHTRAQLPAYKTQWGDMLEDLEFNFKQHCKYHNARALSENVSGEIVQFWLTQVTCNDEEELTPVSMYLFVPKVK